MEDLDGQIRLHSAGATVRHSTYFSELPSHRNSEELSQEFIDAWVIPFYMNIGTFDDDWAAQLIQVKERISKEIVMQLLGDFNWRTRQTGAFFAAIKGYADLTDIIGTNLLKSEVCYAGKVYAQVLAAFNTPQAVEYLDAYLTYYLAKPDLWFDQMAAMEAVAYLDAVNNTSRLARHSATWLEFVANKPNWGTRIETDALRAQAAFIEKIKRS